MSEKIKQKKKYRFNFIDFIILFVIAAVLVIAGYFTLFNSSSSGTDSVTIEYVVELKTIKDIFADKINIGDNVIETVRNENIGTVSNVSIDTAKATTQNVDTGEMSEVSYPEELKDILVTIRKEMTVSNDTYTVNGFEISVGTLVNFRVPNYVGSGYCVAINVVE